MINELASFSTIRKLSSSQSIPFFRWNQILWHNKRHRLSRQPLGAIALKGVNMKHVIAFCTIFLIMQLDISMLIAQERQSLGNNGLSKSNVSSVEGIHWNYLGLSGQTINAIAVAPNGFIYAGLGNGGGIFCSSDLGVTWNQFALSSYTIESLALDSTVGLYAGTNGYIWHSSDNGATWAMGYCFYADIDHIIVDNRRDAFAATDGCMGYGCLYQSRNYGISWDWIYSGLYHCETYFRLATDNNNNIYAAKYSGLIRFNKVSNKTVESLGSELSDSTYKFIYSVATDSTDIVIAGSVGKIYQSTDSGSNWTSFTQGLTNSTFTNMLCYRKGCFAATSSDGFFYSTDRGLTWTLQNDGLTNTQILTMTINPNREILLGTSGGGIFQSSGLVTSISNSDHKSTPSMFRLSQNYPNPFNPSTTISFTLPSRSFVTLKVFDIIGREIATIVSEELPAGNYSKQWNAANMSSGIYFYRLEAGSFTETKKLVLLR